MVEGYKLSKILINFYQRIIYAGNVNTNFLVTPQYAMKPEQLLRFLFVCNNQIVISYNMLL